MSGTCPLDLSLDAICKLSMGKSIDSSSEPCGIPVTFLAGCGRARAGYTIGHLAIPCYRAA
ncbi:hypothetical protein J6590_046006 [Homalodisca vitripennis]|nr:hypothetical protein J6590_046006 [Homalodisca vitripennis]